MVQGIGEVVRNVSVQDVADGIIQQEIFITEFHLIEPGQNQQFDFGNVLITNATNSQIGVVIKGRGAGFNKDYIVIKHDRGMFSFSLEKRIDGAANRAFEVLREDLEI
jgi:hypothetical protein